MRNLARIDERGAYTNLLNPEATTQLRALRFSEMVAVSNPELPECGCSLPQELAHFARDGQLGFRVAVMEVGNDPLTSEQVAMLHIVFCPSGSLPGREDYFVLRLGNDGSRFLTSVTWPAEEGWLLQYQLGFLSKIPSVRMEPIDLNDEILGIPGLDQLCFNGPYLVYKYLHEATIRLMQDHSCKTN